MKKIVFSLLCGALFFWFWACEKVSPNNSSGDEIEESTHESVDLGLPSGLLWATCNIGATKPEEFGDYFAWGETQPKNLYNWSTYKWCNGSETTITKYCISSEYGLIDNKTTLALEDDAANANWGGTWRMPTLDEIKELRNNCIWTWTTYNGVEGYEVKSKINENSIFLPAAGWYKDSSLNNVGTNGNYFTASLASVLGLANALSFYTSCSCDCGYGTRYYGQSVRAVCPK